MTTQHTKGPWEVRKPAEVFAADGTFVTRPLATKDGIGAMQFGEMHANARLIAASPDLLEALEWFAANLVKIGITYGLNDEEVAMLKRGESIIAKVTGK